MTKARSSLIIVAILSLAFVGWRFLSVDGQMTATGRPVNDISIIEARPKQSPASSSLALSPKAASMASTSPHVDDTARHAAMFFENSPDMRDVRKTLLGETRDTRWADAAEVSLRTSFSEMPGLGKDGRMLNIRCGSATCEVAGELGSGAERAEAMDEMQGIDFMQAMEDRGYRRTIMGFAPSSVTGRGIFLAYYQRGPAR